MERPVQGVGERLPIGIERNVAREPDGARDELLAGPGGARNERGDVVHPVVEQPPVALHVVGEDRLPDRRAQTGGGA